MEQPELLSDERFATNALRVKNHAELKPLIEVWSSQHTIDEVVESLLAVGVPSSPINTIDRVVKDPHIAVAREMFVEVEHPIAGKTTLTGDHIKFSDKKAEIRTPAPTLGQHNFDVYEKFVGLSEAVINEYIEKGVF